MPWTYILRCSDGAFYTGSTHDLDRRVWEHNSGLVPGYTAARLPVTLVFALETKRINDAWALERQIKSWRRAKKIALIGGEFECLPHLADTRR